MTCIQQENHEQGSKEQKSQSENEMEQANQRNEESGIPDGSEEKGHESSSKRQYPQEEPKNADENSTRKILIGALWTLPLLQTFR